MMEFAAAADGLLDQALRGPRPDGGAVRAAVAGLRAAFEEAGFIEAVDPFAGFRFIDWRRARSRRAVFAPGAANPPAESKFAS